MAEQREIPLYEVYEELNTLILFCRQNATFAKYETHLLKMEDDVYKELGKPSPDDNPWLEQAAEHEANAREGVHSPPPPGYPYGPYD